MNAWQTIVALTLTAIGGLASVFGLLHFNRDEAGKVVAQQTAVLTDMTGLYTIMKKERDEEREKNVNLAEKIDGLEEQITGLNGKVTGLESTITQLMEKLATQS